MSKANMTVLHRIVCTKKKKKRIKFANLKQSKNFVLPIQINIEYFIHFNILISKIKKTNNKVISFRTTQI